MLSRSGATTSLEPHLSAFAGNPAARAAAQRNRKANSRMEASVAGYVLRHPGREWRRPCAAPSCEVGGGL